MKFKISALMEVLTVILVLCLFLSHCFVSIKNLMQLLAYIIGLSIIAWEIHIYRISKNVLKIIGGSVILFFICHYITSNGSLSFPVKLVIQYTPVVIFLIRREKLNKNLWYGLAFVIFLIVEYAWLKSPDKYILFQGISRNYISIFLILALFFITIICERENKEIPIWAAFIFAVCCIIGTGRAGILSGILYLTLIFLNRMLKGNNKKSKTFKVVMLVLIASFVFIFLYMNADTLHSKFLSRFVNGSESNINSNNGRMIIYLTYINKAISSWENFVFGVNVQNISIGLRFTIDNNLHCSYLQLHSVLGALGIILLAIYIVTSFKYLKTNKMYYSSVFFFVFLIRIATDYAICGYITDIVLLYYILVPKLKGKLEDESNNE